jgi:AcrR family transcriptional regulator
MPQVLKDDVARNIRSAALRVFAQAGYEGATMAAIAKGAGLSTGNLYRYYGSKDILFDSVIDRPFVHRFRRLLRRQIASARGAAELLHLAPPSYVAASNELLRFCIDNRLQIVVLLGKAQASMYAALGDELVEELVSRAIAHFRELTPGLRINAPLRLVLEQIYRSLVATMVRILDRYEDEQQIREGVTAYARFHLAGLAALFK